MYYDLRLEAKLRELETARLAPERARVRMALELRRREREASKARTPERALSDAARSWAW